MAARVTQPTADVYEGVGSFTGTLFVEVLEPSSCGICFDAGGLLRTTYDVAAVDGEVDARPTRGRPVLVYVIGAAYAVLPGKRPTLNRDGVCGTVFSRRPDATRRQVFLPSSTSVLTVGAAPAGAANVPVI